MSSQKNKSSYLSLPGIGDVYTLHNNINFFLLFFLIFSNFWILKIFSLNFLFGIFLSLITFLLIFFQSKRNLMIAGMVMLLAAQFFITDFADFTYLDNDQQRVQSERLVSYPPIYLNVLGKNIWFQPRWIEDNPFVIAISKIEYNLFLYLNPNYYFFGGFPKNNSSDYEKVPFILLPFFIIGILSFVKKKKYSELIILFFIPLSVLVITLPNNMYGSFLMFPFIIFSIYHGILDIAEKFKNKYFYPCLIALTLIVVFMQINFSHV